MNIQDTFIYLKELLLFYLDDLKDVTDSQSTLFEYGEKTAYTECLEVLQLWEHAARYGLDFDIEKKYPLIK